VGKRIVVLCGTGGNGGGALVALWIPPAQRVSYPRSRVNSRHAVGRSGRCEIQRARVARPRDKDLEQET
jgi:hypothetical protein